MRTYGSEYLSKNFNSKIRGTIFPASIGNGCSE